MGFPQLGQSSAETNASRGGQLDDAELTLHEAAEVLGVHYMTVYRYVRLGLLSAAKVGGTWRISRADFDAFQAHDGSEGVTLGGGAHRRAPWAERLESRLIAGDVRGSWSVVEAALAAGARLDDIYSDVLTPALNSIGAVTRRASKSATRNWPRSI